jgi:hypothetical protein
MADLARVSGIDRPDTDQYDTSNATVDSHPDGTASVNLDGAPKPAAPDLKFDDDLTPLFTDHELGSLGNEIVGTVDEDDRSRDEWKKTYARGLNLLGLKYEDRTEPWENACGAFHPMLLESVIRFNAQEMMDIFPAGGPIKTEIIGRVTDPKEAQARRMQTDLNWLAREKIKGYRQETDMLLFNLPLAGTAFRKFRFDTRRQFPAAEYVLPEHVVMPYSAASLESTERFAIILLKTKNWIEAQIGNGFYRDVGVIGDGVVMTDDISEEKDRIEGRSNTSTGNDYLHRLYEANIDYYFEEDSLNVTKLPVPYVITVSSVNQKVLSIRRNWKENDKAFERQVNLVQHKYMPGFGPYGIGLINILGGLTESATSILRQLVDAGTLSNLPAGYKTKAARIKDDSTPIGPGEWRDVDVGMDTLKESFFALPYKEPSQVLAALLGQIVDEGRRIGSVADMKITDMTGQNMPVGTTLAIIERSMKVMSAVQQRLYESFKNEFKVIAEIVKDFMGQVPYAFELEPQELGSTRAIDYDYQKVSVIPVADPNSTTMAQRIMVVQAIIQMAQGAPTAGWDLNALYRDAVTILGSNKGDIYLPPSNQVQPADPVTENMNILNGKPVAAGPAQDHLAHIQVHMDASQDPQIVKLLTNNPKAPAIQSAMQAHVLEHLAFQYRAEIEQQMGAQLPPPDQPLPDDVEYNLSGVIAQAAQKLLQKNQGDAEQTQIQQNLQDPVLQNETRALDIKERAEENKFTVAMANLDAKAEDRVTEALMTWFKEMSETDRAVLVAELAAKTAVTDQEVQGAKISSDLTQGVMGHLAKILVNNATLNAARADQKAAA